MKKQPEAIPPCPQCKGERVLTRVQGTQQQVVALDERFDPPHSPLVALTCTNCGLTQFYATHPQNLKG